MELVKLIDEISLRMRLMRALEEADSSLEEITERESLILELINDRGRVNISDISVAFARVAPSTISMTVTKLWRKNLVSKRVDPENQRVTLVELTLQGEDAVKELKRTRAERYQILIQALGLDEQEYGVLKSVIARAIDYLDSHEMRTGKAV
jgi:DNA-binding MarR family transcriptional regulator